MKRPDKFLLRKPLSLGVFLFAMAFPGICAGAGAAKAADLVDADTVFFVLTPDLPALSERFHESAFGELWENEELREFIATTYGDPGDSPDAFFNEEAREHWERFNHFFDGGLAMGVTAPEMDWETMSLADTEGGNRFAIIADFSGTEEDLADFLEPWSDQRPSNVLPGQEAHFFEEDFMGQTLAIEKVTSAEGDLIRRNGWGLIEGTAVLAQPVEYLRDVVARLADPSEGGSLTGVDRFLDVRDRAGDGDLLLYLDLETLAEFVGKGMEIGVEEIFAQQANPLGISAAKMTEAFGLGELRTFHLSASLGADRSLIRGGLAFEEKKGVLSLLSYGEGPIPRPSLAPEDSVSTDVGRVRWMEAWLGMKEMLGEISPNLLMMLEMMRNNFLQSTGVDFERSLIGALGEETVTFTTRRTMPNPGENASTEVDSVLALELNDPSGFELALEGLKGTFGMDAFFDQKEYGGVTIHTMKSQIPGDPDAFISYAVTGELFLIGAGASGLLEGTLARSQEEGAGFWNRPEVLDILAELPAGTVGAGYADLGFMVDNMIDVLIALKAVNSGEDGVPVDLEDRPQGVTLPHFMFSGQVPEENGLYFEGLILPNERLAP